MEVKESEWEVAIAEEEIRALQGLLGFGATKPDEASAPSIAVGGGIKGVPSIDESEREVALFSEEFTKHQRSPGGGGRGHDFAHLSGGKLQGRGLGFLRFYRSGAMSSREFFPELTPKLLDL